MDQPTLDRFKAMHAKLDSCKSSLPPDLQAAVDSLGSGLAAGTASAVNWQSILSIIETIIQGLIPLVPAKP